MAGDSIALWKLWTALRNLKIEKDLTKRIKLIDEFNNVTQIVIQRSVLNEVLPFAHEHYRHVGMAKTFDWVQERF